MTALTLANVGSPLVFLGLGHLLVGNLLIGWLEGSLLARWLGLPRQSAVLWMILGNYFSAATGVVLLVWVRSLAPALIGETLSGARLAGFVVGVMLLTFALSCIVEFLFLLVATIQRPARWASRIRAHIGVQAVSYSVMLLLYWWTSPMTLLSDARFLNEAKSILRGDEGWVYYVDPHVGTLWRVRLDGTARENLGARISSDRHGQTSCRLYARPRADGAADIVWGSDEFSMSVPGTAAPRPHEADPERPSWFVATEFPATGERAFTVRAAPSPSSYLGFIPTGVGQRTSPSKRGLSLQSPIIDWCPSTPTLLPRGGVVVEFGPYLLLVNEALDVYCLGRGRCPAVVLEASATSSSSKSPSSHQTP